MHLDHLIRQKSYEKMVFLLRAHPVVLFGKLILLLILMTIPAGMYVLISNLSPDLLAGRISFPALVLAASVYYLWIWLLAFTWFIDYYLDVWIVTNDRVLSIEQHGLFARTIAELDLYKIQDVTSEVKGVLPTMFNYGNVFIQTAGTQERFIFEQVRRPHDIRKTIVDLIAEDRKYHKEPAP